ncbi:hypothetical protein ACUNV4_00280 [Granulosicoccus sp. 3-233]|uniref:hypothetical protein n=1 Tax=Granulosicoccus sp. 3-233 TaxID=3417969 RepID=UPI003D346B43
MKPYHLLFPLILTTQLLACSSSDDATSLPADDDDDPIEPPVVLQIPEYSGELTFASTLQVDLDSMISEAGLNRVDGYQVSRDGSNIRADVLDEDSEIAAIALIDTVSGEASWLLTDIGKNTQVVFDADNSPVAVIGLSCATVSYNATFSDSLFDLSPLSPTGRCIYKGTEQSADGNVVLFNTYDPQDLSQYDTPNSTTLHAYTLDSANLVDYPDTSIEVDGVVLSPRLSGISYQGYELSDDGQLLFSQQWWEGTDADGGTLRQVGATLWNTRTNEWWVRGLAEDSRGCTITDKVNCLPPYSYTLSADGTRQYSEIPVGERFSDRPPWENFDSSVELAMTGLTIAFPLQDINNVQSMITNDNGDQLVLFSGSYGSSEATGGYYLYQRSSDSLLSLNRALRACSLTDGDGNELDESTCEYTSVPGAITSEAEYYTADGQHVLFRSISRFTDDRIQAVDNFLLDVEDAAMYSLPEYYGERSAWISGDGSVVMGVSDFPEYDVLIGRR